MSDITYDKQIFAANLRRLMDRHGEKQVDVARLLGVTKASVSAYCDGEQMPRMDKLEQLARHYGGPRAALIESEAPAPAAPEPAALSPIEAIYGSLNGLEGMICDQLINLSEALSDSEQLSLLL